MSRRKSKTVKTPRNPYEKQRIDDELELVGKYGLRNKRELWRVHTTFSKIRKTARNLLTLDENDPKRVVDGQAMIRRLRRVGILDVSKEKLDFVLSLKITDFLDRRLQTIVYKKGLAKSVHHARVLITQRHIAVGETLVTVPSFLVRTESEKHIRFAPTSPFGGARAGRAKRKLLRKAQGGNEENEEEEN